MPAHEIAMPPAVTAVNLVKGLCSDPSLVLDLSMDAIVTGEVLDSSDFGNDGTLVGATHLPVLVAGKIVNALQYDGTEDTLDLGSGATLKITDNFTILGWIKTGADTDPTQAIYSFENNALFIESHRLKFQEDDTWGVISSGVNTILANTWYHVGVIKSGAAAGGTKLYINAVQNDDATAIPALTFGAGKAWVGSRNGTDWWFSGIIDEPRIYNRVLGVEEINTLYHFTTPAIHDHRHEYDYPLTVGTDTFTRTGIDGAEIIAPLFAGDEFVGEVPEGQWVKGWDANISTFIAKLDGAGALNLGGVAAVAGTAGNGWLNSQHPFVLMDEAEFIFELEAPVSDTGAVADRDIEENLILTATKAATDPALNADGLAVQISVSDTGLLLRLYKEVAGAWTVLFDGSTYDDTSVRDPAADKFTIWRLLFHESHSGTAYRHVHVYLKQSTSFALAEAATEYELTTSPYDTSTLTFTTAYPAYRLYTQNTTYFNSANRAVSQYIKATARARADFNLEYACPSASLDLGECKLFDTNGSAVEADWSRVRSVDHIRVGDIVIQNGLIRAYLDEGATEGLMLYWYSGAAWTQAPNIIRYYGNTSGDYLRFPYLSRLNVITSEKIELEFRYQNSASEDNDVYIDMKLTVERGRCYFTTEALEQYPIQTLDEEFYPSITDGRFCYVGDVSVGGIGDADLSISGNNTTMSDNFTIGFDDAGRLALFVKGCVQKPDTRFRGTNKGSFLMSVLASDIPGWKTIWAVSPLALIANLFMEAESATISAAVRLYMDGAGEDTVTEGQAVWTDAGNCTIDVNDATAVSVGTKDVSLRGTVGGTAFGRLTPVAPLANLLKFDSLKLYLSSDRNTNLVITLLDSTSKWIQYTQAITTTKTQYTIPLPHSATDLQGWELGTFVAGSYAVFKSIQMKWTAVDAVHYIYIDGLHFYIGTTTTRGRGETLSGGSAVVLDANLEDNHYEITGVTTLPIGRYLAIIRAKDTDQPVSGAQSNVYNLTDVKYLNEEATERNWTFTSSFSYYAMIFDIRSIDTGDTLWIDFYKLAAENTIFVDYFLIIPIGDPESFPQNLAHNALRTATVKPKRILKGSEGDITLYVG